MSDHSQATTHQEDHTGPIKTPLQLMMAAFFSFVIPIFIIIAIVAYVVAQNKPSAGASNLDKQVAQRILKIGTVEIRDANRPLKPGADVYKAQCAACHAIGAAGAPKFAYKAAWTPRIANGYATLLNSALKGKGAMGAQSGGDFEDLEIGRAIVYMANNAGGSLPEPQQTKPTNK